MRTGRPKIHIDWSEMDKLCLIQCTLSEIANWFNCSEDTIKLRCKEEKNDTFTGYFKKKSTGGKISLRRSQFKYANNGSVPLLIWLGKQYLGQSERQEATDGDKPQPKKIEIVVKDASKR